MNDRTEIPNIVFELLEDGEISKEAFMLYSFFRRIAGESDNCCELSTELAKKCHVSRDRIKKLKDMLSKKFKKLGGKSLITIYKIPKKPHVVTITDIWFENENRYTP